MGVCPEVGCTSCAAGQYKEGCGAESEGSCRACVTSCPAGEYLANECDDGRGTTPSSCEACAGCPLDHRRVACGGAQEGECEPCRERRNCAEGETCSSSCEEGTFLHAYARAPIHPGALSRML